MAIEGDAREQRVQAVGRRGSRVLVGVSLFALTAVVTAAVWLGTRPPPVSTARLPDGSTLRLEAVTLGPEEKVYGSAIQQALYAVLPGMKGPSGCRVYQGMPGMLVFHTVRQGGRRSNLSLGAVAFDEHGCKAQSRTPEQTSQADVPETWEFQAFPRRGQKVGLRLYQNQNSRWTPVAELMAPNPDRGPHPTWRPSPLPQTQKAGDLSVTLTRLMMGENSPDRFGSGPIETQGHAAFRLSQPGTPSAPWTVAGLGIQDASGNDWAPGAWGTTRTAGSELDMRFPSPLWQDETAWKLRVELSRTDRGRFAPDELWTARNLPVPAAGKVGSVQRGGVLHGVPIAVESVLGPRATPPSLFSWLSNDGRVKMVVRYPAEPPEGFRRTLVGIRDDQGRRVEYQELGSTGDNTGQREILALTLLPGARKLHVTFAVHKSRFVEFLAPKTTLPAAAAPGPPAAP